MATKQQIKMLLARSKEAGIQAEWSDFADMDNGQIDIELAKIAEIRNSGETAVSKEAHKRPTLFNELRYGMCCKIICAKHELSDIFNNRAQLEIEIAHLYNIISEAERNVHVDVPSVLSITKGVGK